MSVNKHYYTTVEQIDSMRGPYQPDSDHCGVHVCLVALAIKNNAELNYTSQDVHGFRSNFLDELILDPMVKISDSTKNVNGHNDSDVQDFDSTNLQDFDDEPVVLD
jgi:Ulp1 family protease